MVLWNGLETIKKLQLASHCGQDNFRFSKVSRPAGGSYSTTVFSPDYLGGKIILEDAWI
jgi:hypothetical protein